MNDFKGQRNKITELEAEIETWKNTIASKNLIIGLRQDNISEHWNIRESVADELEEKIKTKNVGLPINPMIYAIHIKPSIERLRGKVPEQYNYDTPAKPATDHEEVAPDPDIQKQREKKSNA